LALEPGVIFAIVAGAASLLIVGTGVAIAGGLYTMDRAVRRAKAAASVPYNPNPTPEAPRVKPELVLVPSPVTQMVAARGYADVEPTLEVKHTKLGMWVFLASEVLFFTGLIGAFLFFRTIGRITPADLAHFDQTTSFFGAFPLGMPAVLIVSINTFILLTSSFAVVLALDALIEGQLGKVSLYLLGVLLLGLVFVMFQGVEWWNLFHEEVLPTNSTFGTAFYFLTGFHGLHVIGGLLWALIFLLPRAFRGTLRPQNASDVEIFGLYWHFVDIVWIVLFTIIYLLR
jgi:heme/copper-type cytochrome/quinol oxidase subunit 3